MQRAEINGKHVAHGKPLTQRATEALNSGDAKTAAALARNATELAPSDALAWELLSISLHRLGDLDASIAAGRRAVELKPDAGDYHANLGVVLRAAGHPRQAEASYRAAIAANPGFAAAHHNLGNLLKDDGRFEEAAKAYRTALALQQNYVDAWSGLGHVLQRQGKVSEAIEASGRAVELAPGRADLLCDFAMGYLAQNDGNKARELLHKAIALDPASAAAHGNLAAVEIKASRLVAAERACRRAMELAPDQERWISNLGVIAKDFGRFDEAEAMFRKALALRPGYDLAHANLLFCLNYHPDRTAEEIYREYVAFDAAHARPHMPSRIEHNNDPSPARRLRVAFLSPDFREHAARHFLEPLLTGFKKLAIEVYCYAEVVSPDRYTEHFKGLASQWRSTVGMSDDEVADLIRKDAIDIAVDFGGHTASSRILALARKPAPIQIAHHLGHGYTSGMSAMDVFLSDAEMAPVGSEHLFSEKRIYRLPRIPVAYTPPPGMPEVAPLPALRKGYVTFGYFGRIERLNDRVVAAWAAILKAVPGSRLMLNSKPFSDTSYCDLMAGRFAAHGIPRNRLDLVFTSPQSRTWAAYGEIDIALDPFPHNAGTTTIEALYLGAPVVSVNDRPSVGRFGASTLGAVGLSDWVANDIASYVTLAAEKARNLDALANLRAGLRARFLASPLADGDGLARDLEAAFRTLWAEWCAAASTTQQKAPSVELSVERKRQAVVAKAIELDARDRSGEAAVLLEAHLAEDPGDVPSRTVLSDCYRRLGRFAEAEAEARKAVKLEPDSGAPENTLGNALSAQSRLTEAEAAFTRAVELSPELGEAFNNRALIRMRRGHLVKAEQDLRKALALRPDLPAIGFNLANDLQDQGRIDEAVTEFRSTLAKAPPNPTGHGMMLFALTYHPGLTGEEIFAEFRRWNEQHAARHAPKDPVWSGSRGTHRRLRVGYVSPDFATKSSRHFIEPLLVGHDRSKIEIFCYAEVPVPDGETARLKALAENWRVSVGRTDDELASLIRRDEIDVLVDLGGHTARNRLLTFARKPAPVQIAHFLGHGYTTGLEVMDAFLADHALAPIGSDHLFSERVVRMPRMPIAYAPPADMPDVAPLPALRRGYVTFGNFGRAVRLNEGVIAAWSKILQAVPRSRLVLNTVAFTDPDVCQRYRRLFASHGIEEERVDLLFTTPQPKTWDAYSGIDISLDPFPHNGGTTTIEALWLGVPSVCLRTRPSVGCFGASIMGSVGLPDWIADNIEDYIAIAVARASDLTALAELRKTLRPKMAASPLCDAKGLAVELERVYFDLWGDYVTREKNIDALEARAADAYAAGNSGEAVKLFCEALNISRRSGTLSNLGAALRAAGKPDLAEKAYREAIMRAPDLANAHGNLGNLLNTRGRHAEAEVALKRARELSPEDPHVLRNMALCLMAQSRYDEAEPLLRKAMQAKPRDLDLHDNLAQLLRQRGEPVAAMHVYEELQSEIMGSHRAAGNSALLFQDLARYDEAETLFRRALALNPTYSLAHANLLFCLNYHPEKTAQEIFKEYEAFDAAHARASMPAAPSYANDPTPSRRLRVGFLSPDFREHAARYFLEPLLANYDPQAIELFCYAEVANPDRMTERFKSLASQWRSTVGLSNDEVADLIRKDAIDIMVDFGGHTSSSRVLALARKPAPIQIAHHLGHGYTSGMKAMDVFLSDAEMAPKGSEHLFAEARIVRMPRITVAYTPPAGMPEVAPLPARSNGYVTFGYFGRTERINDHVVAAWAKILQQTPGSRLRLNSKPFFEAAFRDLMAARFARHGIAREQLEMAYTSPQPRTWAAYGDVDIALDPFPHNAGTTTIEALYLGVPVVSVLDRPSVGRFGASQLAALGLRDWVADDVAGYVRLATTKARDIDALERLRVGLRARFLASPLADGKGLARELEKTFRDLWTEWCATRTGNREPAPPAANIRALRAEALKAFSAGDFATNVRLSTAIAEAGSPDADTLHMRGVSYHRLGRTPEAVNDLLAAARLAPERADIRWNATAMLRGLGRLAEAEAQGQEAVRLAPSAPEAHNNLASVLKDMGRQDEAENHYRRAIELKPDYSDAHTNLAWVLSLSGRAREAEAASRRAIEINPTDANAYNNLGTALMQKDQLREAGECFAKAVALKPTFAIAHSNQLFCINYRTDLSGEAIVDAYRQWDAQHARHLMPQNPVYNGTRDPDRRLRIGYVSPDFRYHAVSFFMEAILAHHDPKAVEVTCYAEVANPDQVTERFKKHAHRWCSTVGMSDEALAAKIRADEIDVLIDLAGHTGGNRLLTFARKPAPVQFAHMVGAGTTTGLSAIDAFLTDADLLPAGYDSLLSERPVRLSRMPFIYTAPPGMPDVSPLPALKNGFVTFGCFSRAARINEDVVAAWARILKSVPGSRLLLNSKPYREPEGRAAWHAKFKAHKIEPERVELVYTTPQPTTWDAYSRVDIALDPFPHNAGTTTIEALWLGVPVVSLTGRPPVGRFGAAILGSLKLHDWVTPDVDAYVARAATAASNIAELAALRASLRDTFKASTLGSDAAGLTREIEAAYRSLWREYCDASSARRSLSQPRTRQ